ncbi:MAG: hypothetical protein ACTSUT_01840 [Promethearchaeota archaeon]
MPQWNQRSAIKNNQYGNTYYHTEQNKILKKKKNNPEADVGELERKIDGMVYGLYGLGEEEIGIVENNTKIDIKAFVLYSLNK